ncbi:TIGR03790 family protein [Syntrophus gentianae]|uniref:TIGR03790 family protein n=1 Tax=Syntrophus gentianae TaxID=43775 RepID=A0A1H7V545_9BACT|nr:TIGR03790 family protein [Syntrophus gentianae]SEM04008.1 TIGR03790 family protein [Syntrophus gentianae]
MYRSQAFFMIKISNSYNRFFPSVPGCTDSSRSRRKAHFLRIFLLVILTFFAFRLDGQALVADELLIVANSAVPEGVGLARYYMEKRAVPSANLLMVKTSVNEQIGRSEYNQQIADPVRKYLEKNDPEGRRFKCIVLMYGMPLRVLPPPLSQVESSDLKKLQATLKEWTEKEKPPGQKPLEKSKEFQAKSAELKKKIQVLTKAHWRASVDSELALVREKSYDLEGWLPNRFFVSFRGKKIKNMPQSAILVSRLEGPTPAIVRRIIDDSLYAEEQGLPGKAYFDTRWPEKNQPKKDQKLSAYEQYDQAIHNTARIVRKSGRLPVVVDDRPTLFQPGEAPDASLYCGWYSLGKYIDAFTWVRGAVGYHVASSECTTLKKPDSKVWCKVMLEKGVAATVGPVAEPYLQSFPVPEVFFGCLLDGRVPLAECYGLSNPFWSWQQVLIGDPLYRPFLRRGFPTKS